MDLSLTETTGVTTLIESPPVPPPASGEHASPAGSFQSLLSQPAMAAEPQRAEEAHSETSTPAETSEPVEKATASADEEPEAREETSQPAVAIALAIMPLQPLPNSDEVEETADALNETAFASDSTERPTEKISIQPRIALATAPSVLTKLVEAELQPGAEQTEVANESAPVAESSATQLLAEVSHESPADQVADTREPKHGSRDVEISSTAHREVSREATAHVQDALNITMPGAETFTAAANQIADSATANSIQPAPPSHSPATQAATPASGRVVTPPANLPPELAAAPGSQSAPDSRAVRVDAVRLMTRVARAFAAAQDGGEVRIRLSPPELGALRMEVRVLEGALIARLETETAAARTAIVENLPALRERLAEQGVRIERFDVDLTERHAGGSPDRPADRQPPEQLPATPALRPRRMPQVAEGVVARHILPGEATAGRLNVIV
jgi:flagellar hook-length control protein FliK